MAGSQYTLDRDRVNPMIAKPEKACLRCKAVKPNTFEHFPKKLWRTRHETTTTGVCKQCKSAALAGTHAKRTAENEAYAIYKAAQEAEHLKRKIRDS